MRFLGVVSATVLILACGPAAEPEGGAPVAAAAAQATPHPLDGLSGEELSSAVAALRASEQVPEGAVIHLVSLHEPPKAEVLGWQPGEPFRREALAVLRKDGVTYEAIVDLVGGGVSSCRAVEGAQPNLIESEIGGGGEAIKSHPDFVAAMERRQITDLDSVMCEALTPGYYGMAEETGRRLGKAFCYQLGEANFWGRPIEGLTTVLDLDTFEVLRVIDTGAVPVPTAPVAYDEDSVGPLRDPPAPLTISQPDGPGFEIDGHQVSWQNWSFHFRVDPRVGLVVSTVEYTDGGEARSVLYQGSLSELIVPYMDPDVGWYFRTYMDAGEYLVGANAFPLQVGIDCPSNAQYFDTFVLSGADEPATYERAACLFERYAGDTAWRHHDFVTQGAEARKKRDLVLRLAAAIGNYDYIFDWTFQQDGTIRVGAAASGMEQVKAVAPRTVTDEGGLAAAAYGRFVSENTVAINHDHFFNFRLDLDVDGPDNSFVRERLVTKRLPDDHPRRSIWVIDSEIAASEAGGKMRINLERPALWRVINPNRSGPVGYPVSYEIKAGANAVSLMVPEDFPQQRAGFMDHHLWVTPYDPEERYAAGPYPAQSHGGDGLPAWTSADRPIESTDIVVWYTLGFHHVVRAEDWPVLPTAAHTFELRPFDFFDRNPALDLPDTR